MAVLVTAIHAFVAAREGVDARDKREHDGKQRRSRIRAGVAI